ncbi:MAG TPA: hypothetical protein VGL99_04325 [Chloroflexota bacterium]
MSEAATDEVQTFNRIADELYGLRPDAFAAARDEQVRIAKADGHKVLAKELGELRRPTQSAWMINLLWRDQQEVLEQLIQLAQELTSAQAAASGPALQELTKQRRQLENALIRRGQALAKQHGVDVSASMEREAQETLSAALARPEVADQVRTGRLVKPAEYAGFGALPGSVAPKPAAPREQDVSREPAKIEDLAAARAAQRAREKREAAQRRVDEARSALDIAAAGLKHAESAVESARQHHQDIRTQIEEARDRLRELEKQETAAEREARARVQDREEAAKGQAAAERSLERAQEALKDSGD